MKEKELEISTLQAKNERLRRQISEERKKLNGAEACHLAQAEEELEDKEYAWLEREKVQAESAGAAANNPLPSEAPDQAPDKTADTTPLEPSRFSGEELKRLHRSRVRFYTETERPLVSIIILNRNGLPHLRTLAASLEQARFYDRYELIVVDNGSTDGSVAFLKSRAQALGKPLRLIENETNESFSVANNQAAQRANGSFLLFMNNDIEVTDGWLDELLRTAMTEKQAGAVGAKLVYPEGVGGVNAGKDNLIQHRGIGFRRDKSFNLPYTRPVNLGNGEQAWPDDGKAQQIGAVTAAVLLVSKQAFESVGGFDEQYVYGYEDVDLCLKLLEKGYNNYYTPLAMLFHHEFGSQTEENQRSVEAIRAGNRYYFREKWQARLNTWLQLDRINGSRLFSEEALCVAFAVTEAGKNASAGDYFTAMELASSLEKRGYKIRYLCRRGPENWYDVGEDVDVLISMLDAYDLNRMYHIREDLVTVAWARNWFSRWIGNPSIQRYSLVLASSKTACDYMEQATGLKVTLFPIATNADRFRSVMNQPEKPGEKAKYGSDYVFTGSYWDAHREIMDCIEPEALPYKLRIFGKNWEKVPKFAEYTGGFLEYWKMPLVYKYTTLVVDDANHATVKFGAVNSRVFDALAVGRLVLTNGEKGAEETFGGMLPVFRSAREFKALTTFYMEHPADRESLIKRLQKFVLENHTYDIRANTLLRLIVDQRPADIPPAKKIAIMTPVRKWSEAEAWGDFHFAVAMKKCFEKKGYRAEIRILPEWEKEFDGKYVIVLRGLSVYHPKKEHVNLMWNISHPDEVTPEEYNQYDAVFVSSLIWAEHLRPRLKVPVYPLLQCTDPGVFNGPKYGDGEKRYELLFVGNSRKELRPILKDLIPTPYDLAVYGNYWHNRIDERYIRGEIIPNHKLGREYHDATILLNDHWEDMKDKGFISNRIFDGLAAGAFIITDDVAGLSDVLKDCVGVYHNREELAEKVKYYMEHPEERAEMAERGMALVRKNHTFRARVDEMLRVMETCDNKPLKG